MMWTLTGEVLEAVSAAPLPLPVGDVKTNGHGPSDGQVAVGGDPHAQQALQRKTQSLVLLTHTVGTAYVASSNAASMTHILQS